MANPVQLPCDGCGQLVDLDHISRRLQRLESASRFRPVHIQTLLLAAICPHGAGEYLYASHSSFQGEAAAILQAAHISTEGKSPEAVLTEFQKRGLALSHVLECPLEPGISPAGSLKLMERQLPAAIARIRRSLKPRRVLLLSAELTPLAGRLHQSELGCVVLPGPSNTYFSQPTGTEDEIQALGLALHVANVRGV